MTWGLRFLVKWVHNVLGFRTCGSQRGSKVFLSQKPSRKVRAVEVPFEGSKRENSSGAPKWAIHVKSLLNDLFKLLRGTFHLLGSTLSDLKGGRGNIFCAFGIVEILVFSSVASPQLQGSQLLGGGGGVYKEVFKRPILSLVSVHAVPSGAEDQ